MLGQIRLERFGFQLEKFLSCCNMATLGVNERPSDVSMVMGGNWELHFCSSSRGQDRVSWASRSNPLCEAPMLQTPRLHTSRTSPYKLNRRDFPSNELNPLFQSLRRPLTPLSAKSWFLFSFCVQTQVRRLWWHDLLFIPIIHPLSTL